MSKLTKRAIRDSFIKLLNEKPYRQITVKDIVEDCGLNRNTFYYYFSDIPQLMESIINNDAEGIIHKYPSIDSLNDCINATIDFIYDNRKAILHIYNSVNRDVYEQYQWKVCAYIVSYYVDIALGDSKIDQSDRLVIIEYLKCVIFGLISGWLEKGINPDAIAGYRRIFELKRGDLKRLVDRCKI